MKCSRKASIFAFAFQCVYDPAFSFTPQSLRNVNLDHGIKQNTPLGSLTPRTYATNTILWIYDKDTISDLPSFGTKEEYEEYLMEASGLPKGFATGSATGSFVPVEAPSMGSLPIKGTIIHLTDGPSDNWAAVFTKNKVGIEYVYDTLF